MLPTPTGVDIRVGVGVGIGKIRVLHGETLRYWGRAQYEGVIMMACIRVLHEGRVH